MRKISLINIYCPLLVRKPKLKIKKLIIINLCLIKLIKIVFPIKLELRTTFFLKMILMN